MKPVYQTRFGRKGNCLAACIATLADVRLELVDFTCADYPDTWDREANLKLEPFGLAFQHVSGQAVAVYGAGLFIAHGPGGRGEDHAVVMRAQTDGKCSIEHNPHPSGRGIATITSVSFIVPIVELDVFGLEVAICPHCQAERGEGFCCDAARSMAGYWTCLRGHRRPRSEWRPSSIDAACMLCPVCYEVADTTKPPWRDPELVELLPHRRSADLEHLLGSASTWGESELARAQELLGEYRDLLRAVERTGVRR